MTLSLLFENFILLFSLFVVVVLDYCATAAAWLTAATIDCSSRWANYTLLHDTVNQLVAYVHTKFKVKYSS